MFTRLRSTVHELTLGWSERTARVRGPRPEPAARTLKLEPAVQQRVVALQRRYDVAFERSMGERSALAAYEYLEWLDAAFETWGLQVPRPAELHDVGCGGFAYALALQRFFSPTCLVGIDVEGHRRLRGGVNRHERILGHLADVRGAEFVIADYTTFVRRADFATAFFPFVTPAPVLAWRLPLRLLRPAALFEALHANLAPDGRLFMANHSAPEHDGAARFARDAGLVRMHVRSAPRLVARDLPDVVLSLWETRPRN
jgi:SAM-dependent methyltransferase